MNYRAKWRKKEKVGPSSAGSHHPLSMDDSPHSHNMGPHSHMVGGRMGGRLSYPQDLHHSTGGGHSAFPSHLGLNEFLWSAGLHSAGLFPSSLLSAFPGLAASAWTPKTPHPPSSLFAQYMMASNPPSAMYPFDLSRGRGGEQLEKGLNLSPQSRRGDGGSGCGGSESSGGSPSGRRSNGRLTPSEDDVIDLAAKKPRKEFSDDMNDYDHDDKIKQHSIEFLREQAKQSLIVSRGSPTTSES